MGKPVCVVVGVGPGNGAAVARRFAREGYAVALLARSLELSTELAASLPDARAYRCDVTDPGAIAAAFASIRSDLGEVSVLVYNAGSGVFGAFDAVSPEDFERAWRINTLGALHACREVAPGMKNAGGGTIIFVGATASRRGGPNFAAFASAKAAQRSLSESMARQLWPEGIHVALLIIDGVVDLPATRTMMPDRPDSFFLQPDAIADTVYAVTRQDRSAWSFEVEARPFGERW